MVVEVHSFLRFLLSIDPFTLEASRQGSISIQTEGALMCSTYVCMCVCILYVHHWEFQEPQLLPYWDCMIACSVQGVTT